MKLNPIKESDYFYIFKHKYTHDQLLYHIDGREIMPIDNVYAKDIVEFYNTGCYVKVDIGEAGALGDNHSEKCYEHLFFDNNGRQLICLNEVDYENLNDTECHGYFEVEVENDGLNIIYKPSDGDSEIKERFSYSKLRGCFGIDEDYFFDLVKTASKNNG